MLIIYLDTSWECMNLASMGLYCLWIEALNKNNTYLLLMRYCHCLSCHWIYPWLDLVIIIALQAGSLPVCMYGWKHLSTFSRNSEASSEFMEGETYIMLSWLRLLYTENMSCSYVVNLKWFIFITLQTTCLQNI